MPACLTDLTKKNNPNEVRWLPEHQSAFDHLKHAFVSYSVLQNPDFSNEFVLQTDACDRGTGAVLLQSDGDNQYPIVFISNKRLPREQRYSIVEIMLGNCKGLLKFERIPHRQRICN